MGRPLDLVGHRDRKILERDPALARRIDQKLVVPKRNLPVRFPGSNSADGDRKVQVQFLFAVQQVKKGGPFLGLGLILRRKVRRGYQPNPRRDLERTGTPTTR